MAAATGLPEDVLRLSHLPTEAFALLRKSGMVVNKLALGKTPAKPDGAVRFVCVSDTHDQPLRFQVPEGDVLLHCGDFTSTGKESEVARFVEWLHAQPHRHKVVIAGNHDLTMHEEHYDTCWERFHLRFGKQDAAVAQEMVRSACTYVKDEVVEIEGVRICGSPWQPEFCNWAFNLDRGDECRAKWASLPEADVLLTHGPPIGVGDLCKPGHRAGCVDLFHEIITRLQPTVHAFGHIHEAYGAFTTNLCAGTTFVNASTCDYRYNPTNAPVVFDLLPAHSAGGRAQLAGVYSC